MVESEEGRWDYTEGDDPETQTHGYNPEELERARLRMNAEINQPDREYEYQKKGEANEVSPQEIANKFKQTWNWDLHNESDLIDWMKKEGYDTANWETVSELVRGGTRPEDENSLPLGDPDDPIYESLATEKNPTAREWWEEEGWKDAEWQWGLKGYSTHWNELSWEQQDTITKKFNAMLDEEPTLFESTAKEESTVSVSGPPAGTQPPANIWDELDKSNEEFVNEGGVGSGRKPEGTPNDEYDYLIGLVKNKEDWNRLPVSVKQYYKIEDGKIKRANEVVHYADEWWDSLSDSDRIYYADKINVRSDNNYENLTVRERDAITDYFGEKIFSEYHGESYAKEGLDSWWGSLSGLEKQGVFDDWGRGYLSNPDNEQSWANYNYGDISWSQTPQKFKDWLVQNSYKYGGESYAMEGYNADTGNMDCPYCEAKFSPNDDWQMSNYKKHLNTHPHITGANEFQPERQGKRVKILTGDYKGQTGVIGSVEIFGDGFTVRVDGVHNEYATGISLEPTEVEFLGGEGILEDWKSTLDRMTLDQLKEKEKEVRYGLFSLQYPPDSSKSFPSGRLTSGEINDAIIKAESLLSDINDRISKKEKNGESMATETGIIDEIGNWAMVQAGGGNVKLVCATCGKDFGIIPENETGWSGYEQQKEHNQKVHNGAMYNGESYANEDNPNHEPAGSTTGGQFTTGDGGGSSSKSTDNKPKEKRVAGVVQYSEEEAKRLGKMWEQHPDDKMFKGVKGHMIQSEYGGKKIVGGRVNIASMKRANLMDKLGKLERDKDDYSRFKDWNTSNAIIAKIKEYEQQAFEELQKINSKRTLSKDGHWVIDANHLKLVKPSLVYPKASTHGGYGNSEFRPRDFEVSRMTGYWNDKEVREMVKIGDTVRVNDYIRGDKTGTTDYVVTDFEYGDEEHDGVRAGGYVVKRSGFPIEDAYVLGSMKDSGSARISDIRSIEIKSDIKMKSKESYANETVYYNEGSTVCPNCGSNDMIYRTTTQQYKCKDCGKTWNTNWVGSGKDYHPELHESPTSMDINIPSQYRYNEAINYSNNRSCSKHGALVKMELEDRNEYVCPDCGYTETTYTESVTKPKYDLYEKVNEVKMPHQDIDLYKYAWESMYGYGSATGRMSPVEDWNQGGSFEHPYSEIFRDFRGLKWSELPKDIQDAWKAERDYAPYNSESYSVEVDPDCEECGGDGVVYEQSRWSEDGVKPVPCPVCGGQDDYTDPADTYGESRANEVKNIEDWWKQIGNTKRYELLEKHGYSQSNSFYEDWRYEDLPDTLQDALSVQYHNDTGTVNESNWKVHTITHGKVNVDLGKDANEEDAINAVKRMYFDDGFIDEKDILSAVKVGESIANEEQINTDTYHYDYSDYWNKGNSYVRAGLAIGAGLSASISNTEWNELTKEEQTKILESGYVTSYESLATEEWSDKKCSKCKGKGYYDHWDNMYGSTKPSCGQCEGTGKTWIDSESHVKSDVKGWLDKTFPTTYEEPQKGLDSETKADEEVNDPKDIGLLSNLLDNELEEQKKGEDEEEDIAILLQLLAPNEKATEKGETYIFMWRKMDKGMREQMLIDVGINDSSASDINWEALPEDHKDALKVKMNQLFRETGEEGWGSNWGSPEETSNDLLELTGITCDKCGKHFEYPEELSSYHKHVDETGHGMESHKKKATELDSIYKQFADPLDAQTGKGIMDSTRGYGTPEADGQDISQEEIIEKKPPKINYQYYKQYPFGRIQKGFYGEVNKSWWEDASYEEKVKELKDIGFGMSADIGEKENVLAKRSWDDLPNEARQQWGDFGNEVELSTMYQARKWWDKKFPDRQWKDMHIDGRQRAIMAFLIDPDTELKYSEEGKYDCKKCKERGYNMLSNADTPEQARKHYEQYHDDEDMWKAQEVRISEVTWNSMDISSRRDLLMDAGIFPEMSYDEHGSMSASIDKYEKLTNAKWNELPEYIKENLGGESYSEEGGQGSGRKPYASKDPARKDKAHVGWKNQGIQNYLDKAEQDYDTGKTSSPDEYEYAGYHSSQEQEAPAPPSGNGGETPAPPTEDMDDEDDDKRRGGIPFGYFATRNCPEGQVYRDGKCRDKSNEADDNKCEHCGREEDNLNDDGLCEDCEREAGIDREESKRDAYEGGKGSGKRGHQQWMRSIEEDPSYGECANCKVITEKVSGKCQMCGKKY